MMHRSTPLLCHSLFTTLIVCIAGQLQASIVTTPPGLSPDKQYRLVFVTSGARSALSPSIEVYNDFVNAFGDVAVESNWKAIGSTETVDAIENTGTAGGGGVPIYNLAGQLVAENYGDLWDGSLLNKIDIDENGATSGGHVWTGTGTDGAATPGYYLGGAGVAINGAVYYKDAAWVSHLNFGVGSYLRMYGMSSVLTVPTQPVPEPASVITWALLGTVGCIGTWWNRRRKAG